ncbi:FecR family protein [Chitinophaga qingshengii]|uniref:FecR family protein n=1 Tax=Chitinophaga qingshengii TaxID=1569794 RepID=A0ABR7TJI7_9BACT|nr:FecR family protein [Chitinophaga qingshengii]MBC9930138.1 FecR family protein [Chitinophaga qingshengii]
MKHPARLLEKFFRGECSEAEKQAVADYFAEHPEALQPWLTEESWHSFHPEDTLSTDVSHKMLTVIEKGTWQKKKIKTIYYKWIAAAVLGAVVTGFVWNRYHYQQAMPVAAVTPVTHAATVQDTYVQQANHTRKMMSVRLKDGSQADLEPGSQIKYLSSFAVTGREIFLTGEAVFKVAPDKNKPFTVHTGNLATTALGTVFKITAWNAAKGPIRVQLISGKVRVQPDSMAGMKGLKTTYLLPGEDLSFDPVKMTAVVHKTGNAPIKQVTAKPAKEIFTFNNEPLANIFRLMSEKYRLTIQYQEGTLTDMSFTGTFDSSKESLTDFLSTIATLNNLTIKQTNNTIYITP